MKLNLAYFAVLGLLMTAPALAAPHDDQHGDKHHTATVDKNEHGTPAGLRQNTHHPAAGTHRSANATPHDAQSEHRTRTGDRKGDRSSGNDKHRTKTEPVRSAAFGNRARDHHSIMSLRINVQAPRHFHDGDYRAPRGYEARHWSHGDRLPRGYYARDYWIGNYESFGLFAPPSGLVWVRVGNDALLVDNGSGDIVQVDYGVFY